MKNLFYFLMVGLAFTALQASVVEAQGKMNKNMDQGIPNENLGNPNQNNMAASGTAPALVMDTGSPNKVKKPNTKWAHEVLTPRDGVTEGEEQGLGNVDLQSMDGGASTQRARPLVDPRSSIDFGHMPTPSRDIHKGPPGQLR